jgi:hypothetical protein
MRGKKNRFTRHRKSGGSSVSKNSSKKSSRLPSILQSPSGIKQTKQTKQTKKSTKTMSLFSPPPKNNKTSSIFVSVEPVIKEQESDKISMKHSSRKSKSPSTSFTMKRKTSSPKKISGLRRKYKNIDDLLKKIMICGETNECINFGINRRVDFLLFDSFEKNKQYVTEEVEPLGEGNNSIVVSVDFEKEISDEYPDKILFNTVLKKGIKTDSDSLVYEYIAGKYFINEVSNYYPNFVLTYDLLTADKESKYYNQLVREKKVDKNVMSSLRSIKDENDSKGQPMLDKLIKNSCVNNIDILLLIQRFKNAKTFQEFFIEQLNNTAFNKFALPILMYQVYFPLSQICDKFTHYDLHTSNVLIYQLPTDKYIKIKYHTNNTVITLMTQHIPKIIDYGRCFFDESNTLNSMNIKKILCSVNECNTRGNYDYDDDDDEDEVCGNNHGYTFFEYDPHTMKPYSDDYYISSPLRNISHDLIFANYIKMQYNTTKANRVLEEILDKIYYKVQYGTPERASERGSRKRIYNVIDMKEELEEKIIGTHGFQALLETVYSKMGCIGTLHIYEKMTRKMEFIPGCGE